MSQTSKPAPKPAWRRRLLPACLLVFLCLLATVFALPFALPWLLQQQGIDFQWDKPQWQRYGFSAAAVRLSLPSSTAAPKQLQLDNLRIRWAWHSFPIQALQADHLQAYWPLSSDQTHAESQSFSLPQALLKWLPQQIQLPSIDAKIAGLGHLSGSLKLQASKQGVLWQPALIDASFSLKAIQGPWLASIPDALRPQQLSGTISTHTDHQHSSAEQQQLNLELHSLGPMPVQLSGVLALQQSPTWQAALKNAQLSLQLEQLAHPALHAEQLQLQAYFSAQIDAQKFSVHLYQGSKIQAQQLELKGLGTAQGLELDLAELSIQGLSAQPQLAHIQASFSAAIEQLKSPALHNSQDWALKGLLHGPFTALTLNVDLSNPHGLSLSSQTQFSTQGAQGCLSLDTIDFSDANPLQKTLSHWPQQASLHSGQLTSQIDFNALYKGAIDLRFTVKASHISGALARSRLRDLDLDFSSHIQLHTTSDWQATVSDAQLLLQLAALQDPHITAQALQLRSGFQGQVDAQQFSLNFADTTQLKADALHLPDMGHTAYSSLQLSQFKIQGPSAAPLQANLSSALQAQIKRLALEPLYSQDWNLTGELSGALTQLQFSGEISGEQGLNFKSKLRMLDTGLQGQATLQEVFFKAANPLQKTLKDWPKLLSLDSGRLRSDIDFSLPYSGPAAFSIKGSASGLSGIINRSELKNLDLQFNAALAGPKLSLAIPNLSIEQLNPGIPIGPIQLRGAHYRTQLSQLLEGQASWQQLQAQLLGGTIWLKPQHIDLKQPQQLRLQLAGLELQELLQAYPAEGLSGSGTIDGELPISFERNTFSISAGQLQARAPGVLQFQSDKIKALGRSNPNMQILADALEDFHFKQFSSGLSYDQSGKLLLNIRLMGQNPDIEKGRPIHLNINLEEDIPALLASIQLSGQVSEIIQKRVRERLETR